MRLYRLLGAAALLTLPALASDAQQRLPTDSIRDDRHFSFHDRGPYRPGVPRPDSLLGYELGDWNTQYSEQERVLLAIAAAAPDRVHVEEMGWTNERRRMRLFIISAPDNIARLDAIRADLARLADPRAGGADLNAVAARTPATVWFSMSVHGNEAPGFETAMQLLYQLAASEEPATVAALRNTLVILNPSSNPDGHERFAVWYNSIHMRNPDPAAYEHREPWTVQGRFNHYRFDMNRDLIASTQREVQAIMRSMLRWPPMVAVDQHGQTENYFFPPAARPINEHLGPDAPKWLDIIGRGNAEAFDRHGWMYYVRDIFDLYYPGYYDTWPSLMGATGMTYETDGGGWKGILWRREDGTLLSFRDGIAKHWVAAMATIETTAGRREERVRDWLRFRQAAIDEGRTAPMKRVVLLPGNDPGRAAELVSALLRSGIEVRRTTAPFTAARAHTYDGDAGAAGRRSFAAGSYVVDLAQPQGRVARAILESSTRLDPTFAATQVERYRRNLRRASGAGEEGYEFYDITAWSLPVAFGVEAFWTEDLPAVTGELLALPSDEPAVAQATQPARRVGGELLPVDIPRGVMSGAGARSAYVFRPDRNASARLAWHLLAEGFRVSVSMQELEAGGSRWPRGSYVVRVARNDTTIHSRIDALARESGVEVFGVASAFVGEAQFGVGSESVVNLVKPEIAVLADDGISQTAFGALWWTLEARYGIRFTHLPLADAGGNLSRFNVIVIPSGSPGALSNRIGTGGVNRLREWARAGGTLITMGGATTWAAGESVNLTTARLVGSDTAARDTTGIQRPTATDTARRREQAPELREELLATTSPAANNASPVRVPGAHFDVQLDRTHWLTHGYEQPRLTVLVDGSTFLRLSRDGSNVAVYPASGPFHRAGFIWPDNTERLLRDTAFLIHEPTGSGHVVLFQNDPMFRGWWRALDRLVLNAILMGPSL
ncbi:MAG TPA: M14 family zinc carboxypeptidase [Gemmatimonadaceae bacterium]|nr:M14 family zinc carboxypeptidase [Gemmatimonadaceae bacterium]